ncbi:hypothetical protein CEXT_439231 [Caerostris extrusa]|uniref:Uncharacterized protein n=1 Tax=Caerostris extrusa TaxID=172846 RepID=A0AAV4N4E6_CAEEX|nr:hypothetical protein CEXT_439231 [Caerostris extrusa]
MKSQAKTTTEYRRSHSSNCNCNCNCNDCRSLLCSRTDTEESGSIWFRGWEDGHYPGLWTASSHDVFFVSLFDCPEAGFRMEFYFWEKANKFVFVAVVVEKKNLSLFIFARKKIEIAY